MFRSIGKTKDGFEVFRSFASDEEAEAAEKEKKAAKDAEAEKEAEKKKADDAKAAKDAEGKCPDCGKMKGDCSCSKGKDAIAEEKRQRMHAAVDRLMGMKDMASMASGEDADLEELKTLMGSLHTEEENAASRAAKGDDNEIAPISLSDEEKKEMAAKDKAAKDEEEAEKKKKEEEGKDANPNGGSDIVRAEPIIPPDDRQISQFDTAALRELKPMIAKSGDSKLIAAFDNLIRSRNKVVKESTTPPSGYDIFGLAANHSVAGDAKLASEGVTGRKSGEER